MEAAKRDPLAGLAGQHDESPLPRPRSPATQTVSADRTSHLTRIAAARRAKRGEAGRAAVAAGARDECFSSLCMWVVCVGGGGGGRSGPREYSLNARKKYSNSWIFTGIQNMIQLYSSTCKGMYTIVFNYAIFPVHLNTRSGGLGTPGALRWWRRSARSELYMLWCVGQTSPS